MEMTGQQGALMTVAELETNPAAREMVRKLNAVCFPTSADCEAPHIRNSGSDKDPQQSPPHRKQEAL